MCIPFRILFHIIKSSEWILFYYNSTNESFPIYFILNLWPKKFTILSFCEWKLNEKCKNAEVIVHLDFCKLVKISGRQNRLNEECFIVFCQSKIINGWHFIEVLSSQTNINLKLLSTNKWIIFFFGGGSLNRVRVVERFPPWSPFCVSHKF